MITNPYTRTPAESIRAARRAAMTWTPVTAEQLAQTLRENSTPADLAEALTVAWHQVATLESRIYNAERALQGRALNDLDADAQ